MSNANPNAGPNTPPEQYQEEWLSAYLDRELTPEQVAIVEARLQMDSNAQQALLDLQRVRKILSGLPAWPESGSSLTSNLELAPLQVGASTSADETEPEPPATERSEPVEEPVDRTDPPVQEPASSSLVIEEDAPTEPLSSKGADFDAPAAEEVMEEEFVEPEIVDDLDVQDELDEEELIEDEFAEEFIEESLSRSTRGSLEPTSSTLNWLKPAGIAASLLAMAGIGWMLWPRTLTSLASRKAESSSQVDSASRVPSPSAASAPETTMALPSLDGADEIADAMTANSLEEFGTEALPDLPAPTGSPAEAVVPDTTDLYAQGMQPSSRAREQSREEDVPLQMQMGGTPEAATATPDLALAMGNTAGELQVLGDETGDIPLPALPPGSGSVPEAAPATIPQIELMNKPPEIDDLSAANLEFGLEEQPKAELQIVGAAHNEAWSRQEVQQVINALDSSRTSEIVISQLPQDRIIASYAYFKAVDEEKVQRFADRFELQPELLKLQRNNGVSGRYYEAEESEIGVPEAAAQQAPIPKALLLFVTQEKADEILNSLAETGDSPARRQTREGEQTLGEEDASRLFFRYVPMVLKDAGSNREKGPADRVILQLNIGP